MSDLIRRSVLIDEICRSSIYKWSVEEDQAAHNWALNIINSQPSVELAKGDLISRADAIDAVMKHKIPFTIQQEVAKEIDTLPSADAEPIVIRVKTFMRKEDFDKCAEDIKKQGENVICIPCDEEVVVGRPHGEWIVLENGNVECSICHREKQDGWDNFCGYCGADMRSKEGER